MSPLATSISMKPDWSQTLRSPALLFVTGFGSGLAPRAPGTAGSLLALVLFIPLSLLPAWAYAVIVAVTLGAGIVVSSRVAEELGIKDPSLIVIDEFVGLWIALFLLPNGWFWALAGFALFRFFDILKPWPISLCDEQLGGGLGIMMDDVVAGLFAFFVLQASAYSLSIL